MTGSTVISVLTTPRRLHYLAGTLRALDDAGGVLFGGRKTVFVDGPSSAIASAGVPAGWGIESLTGEGPSKGSRPALWTILHRAAVAGVPYLLHFEDDVRCTKNAVKAMVLFSVPRLIADAGFLSFFQGNPGLDLSPGVQLFNGRAFWGTQALKFAAPALERFRDPKTNPANDYRYSADTWLGGQLRPALVIPSIVRHIGAETTIPAQKGETLEGHRAGLLYAGDDFDALTLLTRNDA